MDPRLLLRALTFAADRHRNQRRKGEDASPYINHLIGVATVLAVEANLTDETLLVAAVLHDAVEDTETTPQELREQFGPDVAAIVAEVTDDKSLPKAQRKQLQVEKAPHASDRAKLLKIADKVCNVRDVASAPPKDWPHQRRADYLRWTAQVVAGCRGVSPTLDQVYDQALAQATAVVGSDSRGEP